MFLLNNAPLQLDIPFEHNGISYPANWLRLTTLEEKQAIGIVEVPDPEPVDGRYYFEDGSPRDIEEIKTERIAGVRNEANARLQPSDWYVVRKFERGIDIPSSVTEYRQNILNICSNVTELLSDATEFEDIDNALGQCQWPDIVR